jgi:hypothetical protein
LSGQDVKTPGFKGFIPAVFARLVSEAFARRAKGEAEVKVTRPPDRIRNLGMTKSLAWDVAQWGIRVNTISPLARPRPSL